MPNDDPAAAPIDTKQDATTQQSKADRPLYDRVFSIPPPIKRAFDQFPLITYDANDLPSRAPRNRDKHALYLFTTENDARQEKPSFNPGCLKWQTHLKFSGIDFRPTPSNNHASPSGALPFLLPALSASGPSKPQDPVPSTKLKRWIAAQIAPGQTQGFEDVRHEAYASLLDNRIRKAWLFQLYMNRSNAQLVHHLYVAPCSAQPLVQATIAYQLRQAAETELVKSSASNIIVENDIVRDAGEAFEALATLLGENEWFFAQEKPGLFDASVFAYTHLLLDRELAWHENQLGEMLKPHVRLVEHHKRVASLYF